MSAFRIGAVLTLAVLLSINLLAADAVPEVQTLMTERGKLLCADDLTQPLGKEWKTGKGKWEVANGATKGSELKADMHGAVTRHPMAFHVVIQYAFRLDGAKQTTLSINEEKGHCCRVLIDAAGFTLRKDSKDKKVTALDRGKAPIEPGAWHTMVVEIHGKEMLARLDGAVVAFGSHDGIDVAKRDFGLTVQGESASFKNLRVWEATPSKNWDATKAKLLQERLKTAGK